MNSISPAYRNLTFNSLAPAGSLHDLSGNGALPVDKVSLSTAVQPATGNTGEDRREIVTKNLSCGTDSWRVNADYPQLGGDRQDETALSINRQIDDFRRNLLLQYQSEADQAHAAGRLSSSFIMTCKEMANNDRFISFSFDNSIYMTGAAHPDNSLMTLNFDAKSGRRITLAELLRSPEEYPETSDLFLNSHDIKYEREHRAFQKLSDYCVSDLLKQNEGKTPDLQIDEQDIRRVTAPEAKNYDVFNLTDRGLVLNFFYCHAAGYGTVTVPYDAIGDVLSADSAVGNYAKAAEKPAPVEPALVNDLDGMLIIDDVRLRKNLR